LLQIRGSIVKNKLLGTGIALAVILVLVFIVFSVKSGTKNMTLPDSRAVKELISEDKLDEAKEKIGEIAVKNPDAGLVGQAYFDLAKAYEKKGDLVKARDTYETILNNHQNVGNVLEIQESLARVNIEILFSPIITDKDVLYKVQPGDTLSKIAKRFGTTIDLIKASNLLKSDVIRARSRLKVSKAKYKILIDKSQNILTLLSDDDNIVKAYKVSTGKNNSTPTGTFKIVNRMKDPVWYPRGGAVPSESPDNILGSRWLGLSKSGYGIHGTIEPKTVGQQNTSGCVRMLNPKVEELYTIIPVGTEVTIVD